MPYVCINVHYVRVFCTTTMCIHMIVQVAFFKSDEMFVNGQDTETGNTALHIASRHGHKVRNTESGHTNTDTGPEL